MTKSGSMGVVIITWKNAPDERIKRIISEIYSTNLNSIEGMTFREYDSIFSEEVGKVIPMLDEKAKELDKKESRKERGLEAFC